VTTARTAFRLVLVAFTFIAGVLVAQRSFAQKSELPFAALTGAWAGNGQVRLEGGKKERIACRAYYTPREGGGGVGIALRCASTGFAINLRSQVTALEGRVSGTWEEQTFNISGTVNGRANAGSLSVAISGGGLNGSMTVSYGGPTQQVAINATGTALKGVLITLTKQ
jgi:hypothetical protein